MAKKKTKAKVLGFFEYDDVPDFFAPSTSNSGSDSDLENRNPDMFAVPPKVKKKKKAAPEPFDDVDGKKGKGKTKGKPKSSKCPSSKMHKAVEKDENVKAKVTRKRKLAAASPEKHCARQLKSQLRKRGKQEDAAVTEKGKQGLKTNAPEKGKRIKLSVQDENDRVDEDNSAVGFTPSQLHTFQTSTPAHSHTVLRNKRPQIPLTEILSPLSKMESPSAVDFSLSKSDRFGRSYSRSDTSGLKLNRKKKQKKKVQSIFFSDYGETEDEEEKPAVACPVKKSKKMILNQQKEERMNKWAAEVNAEFSDIEQHELCVEST